nr:MAG TPA: hypothetical protein [Caudoviricetes sp.]
MECINIRVNNGRVDVTVDGAKLTDVIINDRRKKYGVHQHPGKQWEGRRDGRRREADGRAQRQRGLHQGRAAPVCLRRGRRPGAGRAAGTENPKLEITMCIYSSHTHMFCLSNYFSIPMHLLISFFLHMQSFSRGCFRKLGNVEHCLYCLQAQLCPLPALISREKIPSFP